MAKQITTNVTAVVVNNVEDSEADEILDDKDFDNIEEYANELTDTVEVMLHERVFGDADDVPILDVTAEVEETDD